MKKTCFLSLTVLMMIGSFSFSAKAADTPDTVVKDFYKWYITAIDAGTDPITKARSSLRRYVTLRLIKQIERDEDNGLDADEFLQTQDMDRAWADAVNVSKLSIKGASATAIVTFGDTAYPRIALTLVKEAGVWKIDRVKDALIK